MRAILIDPVKMTVTEEDLPDLKNATISKMIGVSWIDTTQLGSNVMAFLDDIGLKRKDQRYFHFTMSRTVMAGRTVLLSLDPYTGDTIPLDSRATLKWTQDHIAFLGGPEALEHSIQLGLVDRPGIFVTTEHGTETLWSWSPAECVHAMDATPG